MMAVRLFYMLWALIAVIAVMSVSSVYASEAVAADDASAGSTTSTPNAKPEDPHPYSSAVIVEEVISRSSSPHAYDWRSANYEAELAGVYVDEANNFESSGVQLLVAMPSTSGTTFRFGIRRLWVTGTASSDLLQRTPFRQQAQPTRYEIMGGAGISLLEGRSFTRLSPKMADMAHVLQLTLGGHYNHPNEHLLPSRHDTPEPLPGQEVAYARLVAEVGLRWQLYFPRYGGIFFELNRMVPFGLAPPRVFYYGLGTVWSFGG